MDKQREDVELKDAIGVFSSDEGGRGKHGDSRRQNANNSFIDNTWKSSRINYSVDTLKLMDVTQKNLHRRSTSTAQASSNSMISISKNMYSVLENVQTDPISLRANRDITPNYSKGASIERSTFNSRGDFTASGSSSRSGSVIQWGVARSNCGMRSTVASEAPTPAPAPAPVPQEPLPEPKKKSIKYLIDLCIIQLDAVEMVAEVKQLYPAQYHAAVVNEIINIAVEKPTKAIAFISKALLCLVSSNTISADNFVSGIKEILEFAPDLYIDIPMLYDYLAKIMAPQIENKYITFVQIFRLSESIISANHGHLFLKAIIRELKEIMGPSFVKSKWEETGLQIKQCIDEKLVSTWLSDNKLEFLEGDSKVNEETKKILSPTQTQSRLNQLMNADKIYECNKGWIQNIHRRSTSTAQASSNSMISISQNMYSVLENVQTDPTSLRANRDITPNYSKGASIERSTFNSRGDFTASGSSSRSGSVIQWGVARSNCGTRSTVASEAPTPTPAPAPVPQERLPEPKKKSIKYLIDLCIIQLDAVEMVAEVKQLYPAQYHAAVVNEIINIAVEKPTKAIAFISKALLCLVSSNTISADNFVSGIKEILEFAPDLYIDIPMLYDYLAKIMAPQIENKHITFVQIYRLSESIISANHGHLFLKAVIRELKESMGPSFVKSKWQESGLQIKQWIDEKLVSAWLADNKFEFLEGHSKVNEETKKILSPTQTQSRLNQLMNADKTCECIKGWIQDKIGSSTNEDWFMRALIQAICEHALFGPEGRDVPHFNQYRMNKYARLIHHFGDTKQSREASCLFGIQQLIHRLEHPQCLTLEIFQYLHEQYIISLDGFIAWEESEKESEGKGIMMKTLVSFFCSLRTEADNEDPCSED